MEIDMIAIGIIIVGIIFVCQWIGLLIKMTEKNKFTRHGDEPVRPQILWGNW